MIKITVIMPCLNMRKYIEACIKSVMAQTLKEIEILVVDAGSTDGTLEILNEYEKKDDRIKMIHSEVKSYGYQMNLGIRLAKGEYIGIVETDDLVDPKMYEILYDAALKEKPDYVKGMAQGFFVGRNHIEWRHTIYSCKELMHTDRLECIPRETPQLFWEDNFLWYGIYKAEFMKNIRFHETPGAAFQDIGALFQIASLAQKGIYLSYPGYFYRRDNTEASSYNVKSFDFVDEEYKYIDRFLKNLSKDWVQMYYKKMTWLCLDRFWFMATTPRYWSESADGINRLREKIKYAFEEQILTYTEFEKKDHERIRLLLEDPESLFLYDKGIFESRKNFYNRLLEEIGNRKVVIFGTGYYGTFLYMYLQVHDKDNVVGFCDNNQSLWNTAWQGVPIYSPNEIVKIVPDAVYLVANKLHAEDMKSQLESLGVSGNRIFLYKDQPDIFMLVK